MAHSFAQQPILNCPDCGQSFSPDIWLIVDASERPDLLARVRDGTIHRSFCPNGHTTETDAPLLIFRPNEARPLLFSPAQRTISEQDRHMAAALLDRLAENLGDAWHDEWLEDVGNTARVTLPAVLDGAASEAAAVVLQEFATVLDTEAMIPQSPVGVEWALVAWPALREELGVTVRKAASENAQEEAPKSKPDDPLSVAPQAFMQANTWLAPYQYVRKHLELLGDTAYTALAESVERPATGNESVAQRSAKHLALTLRTAGAAQTFAEKLNPTAEQLKEAARLVAMRGEGGGGTLNVPLPYRANVERANEAEERYLNTSDPAALDEASAVWEGILNDAGFAAAPERFQLAALNDAGCIFLRRYWVGGRLSDLDCALALIQTAVEHTPADSPDWAVRVSNLGLGLRERYIRTGDPANLDAAIIAFGTAIECTPADSPDRAMYLNNLGPGLSDRYTRTGDPVDLDAAIVAWEDAIQRTPADSPNRAVRLSNLGLGLIDRYARTSDPADLGAAIAAWEDAVESTPADSPDRAMYLNNLGLGLSDRYTQAGNPADLGAAIAAWEDAVERAPANSPERARYLSNLGLGLRDRYEQTGDPADLGAAIAAWEDAVERAPANSPERAGYLNNLGNGLSDRYVQMGDPADLNEAIATWENVIERTPANSPDRAGYLNNLGLGLRARYARMGRPEDLDAAIAAYNDALATLDRALVNSPVAFVIGQQERWADLYVQATDALLQAHRPADALAVAEGGKSRLLGALVGRGELRAPDAVPTELAAREQELAARLNAFDAAELGGRGTVGETGQPGSAVANRAGLVAGLRTVWDEMSALGPDAADYAAARRGDRPKADDLAELAAGLGPGAALLSLFTTTERTHLFLWCGGRDAPVEVEATLDPDTLYFDLLANYEEEVLQRDTTLRAGRSLTHRWRALGRSLLGPLLPHLGGLRRLVIAPKSVYHQLPLHALWLDDAGTTLIDHCAVSYVPALGVLEQLRRRERTIRSSAAILGYTPVEEERVVFLGEAMAVAKLAGVAPRLDSAADGVALEAATTEPLQLLHLSCHGYFNDRDVLESGVLLADGIYSARRFMARRLSVDLVTLSACQTAISGSLGGDEMAGLSMALLMAGARSLLLGLWSVDARTTEKMMVDFYDRLWGADDLAIDKAEALRQTMLALRDGRLMPPQENFDPNDPYYWAPFVLVGDWR